ncbi:MAG: hypothetical protein ACXVB0_00165 [Mucilaginibacter sp.]
MNNINDSHSAVINGTLTATKPKIPLGEAITRAANWRSLVTNLPSGNNSVSNDGNYKLIPPQCIFRAININLEDIKQLRADHPNARSIRLYLSISDTNYPYRITGMLVPVDVNNTDMLTMPGQGLTKEEILASSTASTIYDFTLPCPTVCDTQSPLFNGTNSPDPYI